MPPSLTPNRAPRLILLAAGAWLSGLGAYSLAAGKFAYAAILFCAAALLAAAVRLSPRWRSRAAFSAASLLVAVYSAELLLAALLPVQAGLRTWLAGRDYDFRTYYGVVRDLRAKGVAAYPFVPPASLLDNPPDPALSPMGSIANTTTVYCNEGGSYLVYDSDEHGFHNPSGVWGQPADIVFAGDSFTQGACVSSVENFAGRVRQQFPNTVNLGLASNGPLTMLAGLREYLPTLRPKVVFWCYYEGNDLSDLKKEKEYSSLQRYLEDRGFQQDLVDKQPEIDRALKTYADRIFELDQDSLALVDSVVHRLNMRQTVFRVIRLNHLLDLANRAFDQPFGYGEASESDQVPLLGEILAKARADVEAHGGRLVFVFLPGWELAVRRSQRRARIRTEVTEAAARTGLRVIDLTGPLQDSADPAEAFWYPSSHYTPLGYRLVARELLRELESAPPNAH